MKIVNRLLFVCAMFGIATLFSCTAKAQTVITTNAAPAMPSFSTGLQEIYDSVTISTNYAVVVGGARSTTGSKNVAFADYCYNFSQNVGLLIGYDYCWSKGQVSTANLVRGGINLQANLYPLKQFGFTNFMVTPFGSAAVASGNGTVGNILSTGAKTILATWKGFTVNLGVIYEKRSNEGYWNGSYVGGFFAIAKGF